LIGFGFISAGEFHSRAAPGKAEAGLACFAMDGGNFWDKNPENKEGDPIFTGMKGMNGM
jgi:hypothetical protein